jgi:hypothetical protein
VADICAHLPWAAQDEFYSTGAVSIDFSEFKGHVEDLESSLVDGEAANLLNLIAMSIHHVRGS